MVHTMILEKRIIFSMKSFLRASNTVNTFVFIVSDFENKCPLWLFSFFNLIHVSREHSYPTGDFSSDNVLV